MIYLFVSVDFYFVLLNVFIWFLGGVYSVFGNYVLLFELDEDGCVMVGIFGFINLIVVGVGLILYFFVDVFGDVEMSFDFNNLFFVNGGLFDGGLQYYGDMESWYNLGMDVLMI